MSTDPHDLPMLWRAEALDGTGPAGSDDTLEYCAAQLERALAAQPSSAELIIAGKLLRRSYAHNPSLDERRELWAALNLPHGVYPSIGIIRRAATKRFRSALDLQEGKSRE